MCKQFLTWCRKNTSVQVWVESWDVRSTDTNTVYIPGLQSEWQVQLQHTEYHDNAFWHAREQQTYQYVSCVSNIYIPEQDMGDLMRKFYCGDNTTNFIDSEVYYYRCVLEQNLVA